MRRFFSIFLCVFLLLTLALPAFAGNVVILNYEPWLFFYDLEACDENYNIWLGMYSYGGSEELYPIHVNEDDYNAKLLASQSPAESVSEITDVVKPESVEPDLSDWWIPSPVECRWWSSTPIPARTTAWAMSGLKRYTAMSSVCPIFKENVRPGPGIICLMKMATISGSNSTDRIRRNIVHTS